MRCSFVVPTPPRARHAVRTRIAVAFAALVALGALGCGHGEALGRQPLGWTDVRFGACPEDVSAWPGTECGLVEVPLDWDAPADATIALFVRRVRPSGEVRGQLWALDGGPGEPGDGFFRDGFADIVLGEGYELVVPTHRGTVYGTALACPGAESLPACIDALFATWGDGLADFDTHMAARDVAALMAGHPPVGDAPALVFGGSYGTVWAQRLLQVAPERVHGASLDSAADLGASFVSIGAWYDAAGHALLDRCAADPGCAARFPDGPVAAAARVQESTAEGTLCAADAGWDLGRLQRTLAYLLESPDDRALVAPVVLRFDRCDDGDREALAALYAWSDEVLASPVPMSPRFNGLLNLVTVHREMFRPALSVAEAEASVRGQLFDHGGLVSLASSSALFPPEFGRDADVAPWAYAGPLHVVQGGLDPRTPPALADALAATWPHAAMDRVDVPDGGHASFRFTALDGGETCSFRWLRAFLREPAAPFDATCLDAVPAVDWAATAPATEARAASRFGGAGPWEP